MSNIVTLDGVAVDSKMFRATCDSIRTEVKKLMVGLDSVIHLTLVGFFSDGHILLEDVPGAGKTTLAEAFAATLKNGRWDFFQGSADRLPSEILGSEIIKRTTSEAFWKWGYIRPTGAPNPTNILLADEINRNSPKAQSALLGAMQGRKLTNGTTGETHYMAEPFLTIATQNPIEQDGVYPLAEAIADRFALKVRPELLTRSEFVQLITRAAVYARDQATDAKILQVVTPEQIVAMRRFAQETVTISEAVCVYITNLVFAANPQRDEFRWLPTNLRDMIAAGPGNRAGLWLTATAKANAAIRGSDKVEIADVQAMAPYVLGHRITLHPHVKVGALNTEGLAVKKLLDVVPTADLLPGVTPVKFDDNSDLDGDLVVAQPKRRRFWNIFGG